MYNLPASTTDPRHPKGRGNGYVLSVGGKKIYLSGDTQGIPEMRALTGIDIAFVCMNLPYTMDINEAADAVLAFKPHIVYPYHYRGQGGFSDVAAFKAKVEAGNKKYRGPARVIGTRDKALVVYLTSHNQLFTIHLPQTEPPAVYSAHKSTHFANSSIRLKHPTLSLPPENKMDRIG